MAALPPTASLVTPSSAVVDNRTVFAPMAVVARYHDPSTFEQIYGPAMAIGADCARCPLRMTDLGPVMHEIRPNSRLAIIAESPGDNEVLQGKPLVGWSGQQVNSALNLGGLLREDASLINTILCKPAHDEGYTGMIEALALQHKRECRKAELAGAEQPPAPVLPAEACRGALVHALKEARSPVWLTLGKPALEAVAQIAEVPYDQNKHEANNKSYVATLVKQHGHPVWMEPKTCASGVERPEVLLAAYHPAFAARDKKEWLQVISGVIQRAARGAADRSTLYFEEFCKQLWLEPTEAEIVAFLQRALAANAELTVDVETDSKDRNRAKLRTIQLAMNTAGVEEAINIWIAHMDGTPWWTDGTLDRLRPLIVAALDTLPLAGQFLQYDTTVLLREGYMTSRSKTWTDLAILYRCTQYNDLPKNLGAIVSNLFPAPMWKSAIDHKSVDNVNDQVLGKYGIKDVIYEMRCLEPLREMVTTCDSWKAAQLDTDLLPVWREMGLLGLVVDEKVRGEFSSRFNKESFRATKKLQDIAGYAINPRSVPQLQELLFYKWEYRPVILADGEELEDSSEWLWDDDTVGSTSSQALNQLLKRRNVSPDHKEFIETLFENRAYDKLRGTYTDNLTPYLDETEAWNQNESKIGAVKEWQISTAKDGTFSTVGEVEVLPERPRYSRILPVYVSHTIPTGRCASSDPNCMNIPAGGKANIRGMFVAPPGHVIVGADFDQLEARIYAALTGDKIILKAIHAKDPPLDIHALNAATLLAKDESEFWHWYHKVDDRSDGNSKFRKYWRNIAKRFFFLCIYGGELEMLWDVMSNIRDRATGRLSFPDLSKEEVIIWHERCHRDHPEIKEWHQREHDFTREYAFARVPILDERKRWFRDGASKVNAIPNMRVQGSAAAIANRAMKAIAEKIKFRSWSRWTGLFLQVHDFLAAYVPENRADEAAAIFNQCMPYEYNGVPITASAVVSRIWKHQDTMSPYVYGSNVFAPVEG